MDQVNKDTLISLQVEKAKRFLTQADEMVELKHWDLAANRYYYACFHAVQALFIAKGVNAHTHAGINTQFSLHFVKTGIVDISYGSFLARMFQLRQTPITTAPTKFPQMTSWKLLAYHTIL